MPATRTTADPVIEDAEFLATTGVDEDEAARRLGFTTWKVLDKYLRRHDRPDLSRRLTANNRLRRIPA